MKKLPKNSLLKMFASVLFIFLCITFAGYDDFPPAPSIYETQSIRITRFHFEASKIHLLGEDAISIIEGTDHFCR